MAHTDPVAAAGDHYRHLLAQAEAAKVKLLDLCAARVHDGLDTADSLAQRTPFTAVTIRKALRDRGVAPLPTGPKPRKQPSGT